MKQDPMEEWVLRDKLLAAFHRWPVIVLFALVGSLIGLAFAYFWPASYRANVELSVELNPYRVLDDQYVSEFAGAEFRNIDDYKHWQMLQLSILVLSDPFMEETINRLREQNPDWSSISPQDLREMLSANWRNAGVWRLAANGRTSQMASEAVETWRDVIIDLTRQSIASSRDLFRLELALRALNDQLVEIQLQHAALEAIKVDLAGIQENFISRPGDETLPEMDRRELFSIANQMAGLIPGENVILNSFPQEDMSVSEYIAWLEMANIVLERELKSIGLSTSSLEEEILETRSEWEENLINGSGLSATLNIENRKKGDIQVDELYSYSLAAMIGALLGLFAWIMVFLVRVTRKGYR